MAGYLGTIPLLGVLQYGHVLYQSVKGARHKNWLCAGGNPPEFAVCLEATKLGVRVPSFGKGLRTLKGLLSREK